MQSYLPFTRPTLDEETISGVVEVLRSGWLASGPRVIEFEKALAAYLGGGRTVRSLNSGTAALEVALEVCGIGPGAEVIVPALSFVATVNVVMHVGAKPVFAEVELDSRNLDLKRVEAAITPKTKAIMPVHFSGLPVNMDALYALAKKHQLRVIEDAAHAIGSAWKGRKIGGLGDLVCFSFHPNKNMTTIEGGAISTANPEEVQPIETRRFHGIRKDTEGNMDVLLPGGKYNLPDVSARVGLGQLPHLDGFNAKRRALAKHYYECLDPEWQEGLPRDGDEGHSWHMFTLLLPFDRLSMTRNAFQQAMHAEGIGIGIHYPAMHLFSFYRSLGFAPGDFPNAERIGRETVTLPLFPAMEFKDVERVCATMNRILKRK